MSPPLRVLQIIDSLAPSGAERSLAAMAPHLADQGIDVHVAYLIERGGMRDVIESAGLPVHSLAEGGHGRRLWLSRTVELIRELEPAVVHSTLFEADLAGRRAAARCGVASVSSLVNTSYGKVETGGGVNAVKVRAAQAADALTARRVARFHAVTQHVATVMGRRLLVPSGRIEVIHRGRDPEVLGRRSNERRREVRRRLGVDEHVPVVLAIGRQEPQKGFDVLLEAIPKLRARFPEVRLLVAGRDGRASESLRELVQKYSLDGAVSFLGRRDDVADLLAAADVFAFPSLWEGAAGTVLEAMALECPIVASRLPTLAETVDETTAELVSPRDSQQLSDALARVLAGQSDVTGRVRAARDRFERDFTIQVSAGRMARLYSEVTGSA